MSTTYAAPADTATTPARPAPAPIPLTRLVAIELRKMFDTRSGFWLMMSIAISATIATGATILFAPDEALTYDTFGSAVGFPMALILPVIAILSVTSEWSQRSGLTTFTLVPHRSRVIGAKLAASIIVGVVSMGLALAIGAAGNLLGTTLNGVDAQWDITLSQVLMIVLANVLGLLVGFMLGVLLRNSAAAIVSYVVYSFLLPTVFGLLAAFQDWFADIRDWVDFNWASTKLYEGDLSGLEWTQLGVSGLVWLALPLALGWWLVMRSEVK